MARFKIVFRDGKIEEVTGDRAGQQGISGDYAIFDQGTIMDAPPIALFPKELVRMILREQA